MLKFWIVEPVSKFSDELAGEFTDCGKWETAVSQLKAGNRFRHLIQSRRVSFDGGANFQSLKSQKPRLLHPLPPLSVLNFEEIECKNVNAGI